ncbi:metallophosphoesterase family protein [Sphingomonas flavalba]|uniref:metallophosphoesterase family protein n=1 Tax=Sphingomonas flavalba TaxID=2559804 RepID=UPI0019D16984|nr:metallophosphoesterase family protein [Sphingomonas flavalba]
MVLKRLLKRMADPQPEYAVPPGERVYAIGDIHGRRDLLDQLLDRIADDDRARGPAATTLIFLGDLIDRGPDSAGVVARVKEVATGPMRVRMLLGNHEEVFLKALGGDRQALRFLVRIGGRSTIISYGIPPAEYDGMDFDTLGARLGKQVPDEDIAFLKGFEDQIRIGDYLFVHAGIRPRVALDQQSGSDLRWIRGDFLDYRGDHGCMIVHGHTITEAVDEQPNRIGIDTGAFASDRLTALGLEGRQRWYLST